MATFISKFSTPALLALLIIIASCKKEVICDHVTEIKGRVITDANYSVDMNSLAGEPEFANALAKYPQLQPQRTIVDDFVYIMHCRIFYKDLIVFTDYYSLFKNKRDNDLYSVGEIPDNIPVSLTPALTYEQAIAIAKQNQNYSATCISYRLGIYDLNAGDGTTKVKDYRLVWNITGDNEYPTVFLDAQNGKVYYSFDGLME